MCNACCRCCWGCCDDCACLRPFVNGCRGMDDLIGWNVFKVVSLQFQRWKYSSRGRSRRCSWFGCSGSKEARPSPVGSCPRLRERYIIAGEKHERK